MIFSQESLLKPIGFSQTTCFLCSKAKIACSACKPFGVHTFTISNAMSEFKRSSKEVKKDYTEITFEQFQKHILKEIPMNKRTITKEQAQSIVDSACSTWKEKLCAKWATSIVLGLSIDIDEKFYKEMRGACTKEQHELFDKIFGSDKKEIEWDKLKTGSVVMIKYTSQHYNGFYKIDKNKPVNIIFYETKHFINSDKEFKKQGNNSSYYITFHQDGRYVLFTSDKNNDCIIDVIEY